jgi:hypothetical protein
MLSNVMNFPLWDLGGINSGLLIAAIAVIHVFVAQFAVGGGDGDTAGDGAGDGTGSGIPAEIIAVPSRPSLIIISDIMSPSAISTYTVDNVT